LMSMLNEGLVPVQRFIIDGQVVKSVAFAG
jgi:hypothetical protein